MHAWGPCHFHAGGLFGLVGAKFCGPRLGRFDNGSTKDLPGHDMAFVTLGTFMLWFGWFGFNSGSVYVYSTVAPASAVQMVAMNTTLAASSAGLASLLLACYWTGRVHVLSCLWFHCPWLQCMFMNLMCSSR